jgi:hypothetical protein
MHHRSNQYVLISQGSQTLEHRKAASLTFQTRMTRGRCGCCCAPRPLAPSRTCAQSGHCRRIARRAPGRTGRTRLAPRQSTPGVTPPPAMVVMMMMIMMMIMMNRRRRRRRRRRPVMLVIVVSSLPCRPRPTSPRTTARRPPAPRTDRAPLRCHRRHPPAAPVASPRQRASSVREEGGEGQMVGAPTAIRMRWLHTYAAPKSVGLEQRHLAVQSSPVVSRRGSWPRPRP